MSKNFNEQAAMNALMRQDFPSFVKKVFETLNEGREYKENWHIDLMCDKLTDCVYGRTKRQIINVPPRSLKSICTSVALVAWILGRDPTKRVMCISYGEDLSSKHAQDCLKVMRSSWYKEAFPGTILSSANPAVSDFSLTRGGGRLSIGTGGAITGLGGDYIFIDDPQKADAVNSKAALEKTNRWYDQNVYQRLDNKKNGVIIVIMQRIHENDLTGHLSSEPNFEQLVLPAIAEKDEEHRLSDGRIFTRRKGEALHEEREPLERLAEVRRRVGEFTFAGQYQQSPAPAEGGIVKAEWFPRYDRSNLYSRIEFEYIIQSWDTALTAKESSDYCASITVGIHEGRIYVLDVYREKVMFPDLLRAVRSKARDYNADTILVEDTAAGPQLVRELEEDENSIDVKAVKPHGDKQSRLAVHTAKLEAGQVLLPENALWLEAFLHELTTFPAARHDDQVDALSQVLDYLSSRDNHAELPMIFPGDNGDSYIEDGMLWTRRN